MNKKIKNETENENKRRKSTLRNAFNMERFGPMDSSFQSHY